MGSSDQIDDGKPIDYRSTIIGGHSLMSEERTLEILAWASVLKHTLRGPVFRRSGGSSVQPTEHSSVLERLYVFSYRRHDPICNHPKFPHLEGRPILSFEELKCARGNGLCSWLGLKMRAGSDSSHFRGREMDRRWNRRSQDEGEGMGNGGGEAGGSR